MAKRVESTHEYAFSVRLAQRLKDYQKAMKWSATDTSSKTGIQRSSIVGWIQGYRPASREQICCLAASIAQAQDDADFVEMVLPEREKILVQELSSKSSPELKKLADDTALAGYLRKEIAIKGSFLPKSSKSDAGNDLHSADWVLNEWSSKRGGPVKVWGRGWVGQPTNSWLRGAREDSKIKISFSQLVKGLEPAEITFVEEEMSNLPENKNILKEEFSFRKPMSLDNLADFKTALDKTFVSPNIPWGTRNLDKILADLMEAAGFRIETPTVDLVSTRLKHSIANDHVETETDISEVGNTSVAGPKTENPYTNIRVGHFLWYGFTHMEENLPVGKNPNRERYASAKITNEVLKLLDISTGSIDSMVLSIDSIDDPSLFSRFDMLEPLINIPSRNLFLTPSKDFPNIRIGLHWIVRKKDREVIWSNLDFLDEESDGNSERRQVALGNGEERSIDELVDKMDYLQVADCVKTTLAPGSTPDLMYDLLFPNKRKTHVEPVSSLDVAMKRVIDQEENLSQPLAFLTDSITAARILGTEDSTLTVLNSEPLGGYLLDLVFGLPDDPAFVSAVNEAIDILARSPAFEEIFSREKFHFVYWNEEKNQFKNPAILNLYRPKPNREKANEG